jgi:hypothetical protein
LRGQQLLAGETIIEPFTISTIVYQSKKQEKYLDLALKVPNTWWLAARYGTYALTPKACSQCIGHHPLEEHYSLTLQPYH